MEVTPQRHRPDITRSYLQCATTDDVEVINRTFFPRRRYTWCFWIVITVLSLAACTFYHFFRYGGYPTQTKLDNRVSASIPFPAVTICSLNQFRYKMYPLEVIKAFRAISEENILLKKTLPHDPPDARNPMDGDEFLDIIRQNLHNVSIQHCSWNGQRCEGEPEEMVTEFGLCKTYNNNPSEQWVATKTGSDGGLRIIADIHQREYYISRTIQLGLKIILHEPKEAPLPETRGFIVGPGKSALVTIHRFEEKNLEQPYVSLDGNYCINTREKGFHIPLNRYGSYTKESCLKECLLDRMEELCKCRRFFDPGNMTVCSTLEIECHMNNSGNVSSDGCQCNAPCSQTWYEPSLSYADIASFYMADFVVKSGFAKNSSYIRENIVDVRIYYDRLVTHVTEQIAERTLLDILGNLDGLMGLFLGASLLSLIQLLEFLCMFTWKCLCSQKSNVDRNPDISLSQCDDDNLNSKSENGTGTTIP